MGPWSGRLRRQLEKDKTYSPGAVSGACSGRGRGPHLSQNLWGLGVMSPLSLLFRAWQRPAAGSASSWQEGGGGGLRPPFLACGAALSPVPGPVPAVVCATSLTVCPPPQGGGPPLSVPPAAGPAGPSSVVDARRARVCVCQGIYSTNAQTARFKSPTSYISANLESTSFVHCVCVPAHVCSPLGATPYYGGKPVWVFGLGSI